MSDGDLREVLALREAAREALPGCMVRWDRSGCGLLVTDAPRRGWGDAAAAFATRKGLRRLSQGGLLHLDLTEDAYARLGMDGPPAMGAWDEQWFEAQALLASILWRADTQASGAGSLPLLREAVRACARGEAQARAFLRALRQADAAALRMGEKNAARAAASVCAQWLCLRGVGLPRLSSPTRGGTL